MTFSSFVAECRNGCMWCCFAIDTEAVACSVASQDLPEQNCRNTRLQDCVASQEMACCSAIDTLASQAYCGHEHQFFFTFSLGVFPSRPICRSDACEHFVGTYKTIEQCSRLLWGFPYQVSAGVPSLRSGTPAESCRRRIFCSTSRWYPSFCSPKSGEEVGGSGG